MTNALDRLAANLNHDFFVGGKENSASARRCTTARATGNEGIPDGKQDSASMITDDSGGSPTFEVCASR